MGEPEFDWNERYVIAADARFRTTPAGALQLDGKGGDATLEVPREWVELFLAFARPQSVASALAGDGRRPAADGEALRERVQAWVARGLLRAAASRQADPARLTVFAEAAEASAGGGGFPLSSPLALQRPMVFYPGLAALELHDPRRFPWVAALEGAFAVIQREFLDLAGAGTGFTIAHRAQTSAGEWAAAYLWAFGQQVNEETCRRCPETVRLLREIPGVERFGTALYSALAPHTRIAPHHGYSNAKLRCQLPLRVPPGCALKVGDQEIEQREGECIVFDDSFLHAAWNDSDEARFVLVFDFLHPDLTAPEIAYLSALAQRWQLARAFTGGAPQGEAIGWLRAPEAPAPRDAARRLARRQP
jgi:Aspartyl/Asparaginyl beta-hydroxylase